MKRHVGLSITLTSIILLAAFYEGMATFGVNHAAGLPLSLQAVNSHTAVIAPIPGYALPKGLHTGDRVDLSEQPLGTRVLIASDLYIGGSRALPLGQIYHIVVSRGSVRVSVPVRTTSPTTFPGIRLARWLGFFGVLCIALIALAVVWRGRNRAAVGLGLFAIAWLVGGSLVAMPLQGVAALAAYFGALTFDLLLRVGLYIMAESMVGAALSLRARRQWRAAFLVVLGAGAIYELIGPLVYVVTGWGWAEFPANPYGLVLTASLLIPVALLFTGHQRAEGAERARLGWMLWGGGLFATGILVTDIAVSTLPLEIAGLVAWVLSFAVFLYAVLRHRVVDVKVVLSRSLVYAMTTSLVLGLFALFESLMERTAIGHSASLVLELAVPLGIGVSLSTVHRRIDTLVDRVIFRRQYQEEVALRRFAKESAFVSQAETLLDLAVEQVLLHVGAPWVAFYEYGPEGYRRVRQTGEKDLPEAIATDDLALVKLRAHDSDVDLHEAPSGLGRDGYVFPLRSRDHLLGVLVIGPRPGEHYASEERELFAHVAHAVGASLFALRAQATEEELSAARSEIESSAARLDAARAEAAAQLEQARAQGRVSEALLTDLRARESVLLDALRAFAADPRISTK